MSTLVGAIPKRSDYEPMVKAFLPTATGLQLELRCSLLLMRDMAVARKPMASMEAFTILELLEHIATRDAFTPMSNDDLAQLRWMMSRLSRAAADFDSFFAPPLPMEGESGRG